MNENEQEKSLGTMITHLIDNETMKSGIVGRQNVLNLIGGNQVKNPAVLQNSHFSGWSFNHI